MEYKIQKKFINLGTAVVDFALAMLMMITAIQSRSVLAFVFGVLFVAMGVFFWRYFERQRRLEKMTPEERAAFLGSSEAVLMPNEANAMLEEKRREEGYVEK